MEEINNEMWMIVNLFDGNPQIQTLSPLKRSTIEMFTKGSAMDWKEIRNYGWKAIKVNMKLTPSTEDK